MALLKLIKLMAERFEENRGAMKVEFTSKGRVCSHLK